MTRVPDDARERIANAEQRQNIGIALAAALTENDATPSTSIDGAAVSDTTRTTYYGDT